MSRALLDGDVLRLEGALTREPIAELVPELKRLFAATSIARVDLGAVDACDTAGVQLLAAIARSPNAPRLDAPSACLRALCERLGVSAKLFGEGEP